MAHAVSGAQPRARISFEFFPPKTPRASMALWTAVERLAPLGPDFVSVTYGAGGTTRDRTLAAILAIRERARLDVAGHLTCVGATKAQVLGTARAYAKLGCRRIVALRGDAPEGAERFEPHPEGFAGSVDLVAALAETNRFEIWVGAYPEKHPEAANRQADVDHLKRKLDAGATGAITQFFFENDSFLRFRDACADSGITAPIVPGILPVENFARMRNFAERCGTTVPNWMAKAYANAGDEADHDLLSVAICTEQCDELITEGVDRLHLYTMNKPDLPYQVSRALGIEPMAMKVAASCG
ncbi:MAG: methylenetetrahydrofolate reductase [NAD(P)H] [Pseudomonadota bacterium]